MGFGYGGESMSFVNLMGNDRWTDADITNRTESMVRSEFSLQAEGIINRKVSGAGLGVYTLTLEDQVEIGRFAQVTQAAAMEGVAARVDMALLNAVIDHEEGVAESTDQAVLDLVALRKPPHPPIEGL